MNEVNYLFEESFFEKIIEEKEIISMAINHDDTSIVYLLAMLEKTDSLLRCICKVKVEQIYDLIRSDKEYIIKENTSKLIEEAYKIATKDDFDYITDEHMLYAILQNKELTSCKVLERLGVKIDDLLMLTKDYFEENEEYLVNITEKVRNNEVDDFIGKEDIITKIILVLYKKKKSNLILVGPAGVGKSSIVNKVAERLISLNKEEEIERLDIGSLIAGTRYRGDLEERIQNVIKSIKKRKSILFIDEIHMLLSDQKGEDNISIANLLKPILASGEIKCIGATTQEEYVKYIEHDKAFLRRFEYVYVNEPKDEETYKILSKIKDSYEKYYQIKYPKNVLKDIIHYSKLLKERYNPDKSIDILDEAGSLVSYNKRKIVNKNDIQKVVLGKIKKVKNQIAELSFYKEKYLKGDCDKRIVSISLIGNKSEKKINEISKMFGIDNIYYFDSQEIEEIYYTNMLKNIKYASSSILVLENYDKANEVIKRKINRILRSGYEVIDGITKVSFQNTIFIIVYENINYTIGYQRNEKQNYNCDVIISDKK